MNNLPAQGKLIVLLLTLGLFACGEEPAPSGDVTFSFDNWAGPAIPVSLYVPEAVDASTPIVIVMHGASRDLPRYYGDWRVEGEKHGFIVVVPHFSKDHFATSERYNLGHVFDPDTGVQRPPSEWTFAAIEPLFDAVVGMTASTRDDLHPVRALRGLAIRTPIPVLRSRGARQSGHRCERGLVHDA